MIVRLLCVAVTLFSASVGQLKTVQNTAKELRNSFPVLTIALQPGDEDFWAIEDMKRRKGALVTPVYATNGESGESDLGAAYPNELAAIRREEATGAMASLGYNAVFLNFPAPGSVRDTSDLRMVWDLDSLEARLMKIISSTRPDLVVLFPERFESTPSVQWTALKERLKAAMKRLEEPKDLQGLKRMAGLPVWVVKRYVAGKHRMGAKGTKGNHTADRFYKSLGRRLSLTADYDGDYSEILYPPRAKSKKLFYDGIVYNPSKGLLSLSTRIEKLSDRILRANRLDGRLRQSVLREISAIADSVDYLVGSRYSAFRGPDKKRLLLWKEGLQSLKNGLMGVSVRYTLGDSVLTALQVTTLSIDTVTGVSPSGKLWMFFPAARQGWIINETMDQRLPMPEDKEFRIVSPRDLTFNLPAAFGGLQQEQIDSPMEFFVVHTDSDRTLNFAKRVRIPFRFAPRFTVEVLTPLVRAVDGETVVLRLTNHSRDGVADLIGISDSSAVSSRTPFRLSTKGATAKLSLVLQWNDAAPLGSYVLPIDIDGVEVANVAARRFETTVDSSKRVGLVSAGDRSAVFETMRRLGIAASRKRTSEVTHEWLAEQDVVVLDHRIYSLDPSTKNLEAQLRSRANEGAHIVVLSQDVAAWNSAPLIPGLMVHENNRIGPRSGVKTEDHSLMSYPNSIRGNHWESWLFSRSTHSVTVPYSVDVPVRTSDEGIPLIVTQRWGKGKFTFVNLSLQAQWLNIHEGAFRLLANLLAY